MVNRVQHYVSKVQFINQYWNQYLQELLALTEQKGRPTFFFIFSAADSYWPELQKLLQSKENSTHSECMKAVVDNPHFTDWYLVFRKPSQKILAVLLECWMQIGIGAGLNIRPGIVFMPMVVLRWKMTLIFHFYGHKLLKVDFTQKKLLRKIFHSFTRMILIVVVRLEKTLWFKIFKSNRQLIYVIWKFFHTVYPPGINFLVCMLLFFQIIDALK